jgi:adenosylcobinamide-phosphate synthase
VPVPLPPLPRWVSSDMTFLSLLIALVLEQVRPVAHVAGLRRWGQRWVNVCALQLDADLLVRSRLAWCLAVVFPAVVAFSINVVLLHFLGWITSLLWHIAVLYFTLGFRQFSHHFTAVRTAIEAGETQRASALFSEWKKEHGSFDEVESSGALTLASFIRHAVLSSHRYVFGVIFWFSFLAALGLGPAGAVAYRMAELARKSWSIERPLGETMASESLVACSRAAWHALDWVPVRVTALSFAVMGSFEDAIDRWRHATHDLSKSNDDVLMAAFEGAIGLPATAVDEPAAKVDGSLPSTTVVESILSSTVGLVWRSVVAWIALVAFLSLARIAG